MTLTTCELNRRFLDSLGDRVVAHGNDLDEKPLDVDLALPLPPRLRLYMYTLIRGGTTRPGEYKVTLRVPRQVVGEYGSFDHSGGRLALLVAYREDLDVFVLWDASVHHRFKHGGNLQVRATTITDAAANGFAEEHRNLRVPRVTEVVIACQPRTLERAIAERVAATGGIPRP